MDRTRLEAIREDLDQLRRRFARGEIDESTYDRFKEKLLTELNPEDRAALGVSATPTPQHLNDISFRAGTPAPIGPSGGSGRGLRTSIPSLADLNLRPGSVLLGQWKLIQELGKGGFGAVFEAEELHLQERQAVKVLDPAMVAKEELLARFRREVSLMRKLVHPRIVRVYDYREDLSQLIALISMELVRGGSVKQLLATARAKNVEIPVALALEILGQTLEALAEAHGRGVIHRDVTPGNVLLAGGAPEAMLADPNLDPQVKLVDFGIAGLVERSELSQKSRVLGTAAYVAPEVLDPDVEVTPAADVYGAGAMAYELLTGRLPLGRFEEPRGLRAEIDPETNDFVLSLLASRPEKRPEAKAGALGLRKLRDDAARDAEQQEIERRAAAERAARDAQAAEAARRRQAEAEAKRREEAARRIVEEQERRRADAAQATERSTGPPTGRGAELQPPKKGLSPHAWGGTALALVALVIAGVWGVSSQRAAQQRARLEAERVETEKQAAVAAERQRQAQLLEQEKQRATRPDRERITKEQEQARAAESARLEQERRVTAAAAQRQREVEVAVQGARETEVRDRDEPAGTWRDEAGSLLWTSKGNGSNVTWDRAKAYCDGLTLGGSGDWRMPTISELEGLYDASSSRTYKTRVGVEVSGWVWSGDLNSDESSAAWVFGFGGPGGRHSFRINNSIDGRALCVRRFGDRKARDQSEPAGAWRDEQAGLTWTATDNGRDLTWERAKSYCDGLTLEGASDWRMPTISELEGLYDASSPKTYKTRGIVEVGGWVWSRDLRSDDSSSAWSFRFGNGHRDWYHRLVSGRALCVRSAR